MSEKKLPEQIKDSLRGVVRETLELDESYTQRDPEKLRDFLESCRELRRKIEEGEVQDIQIKPLGENE